MWQHLFTEEQTLTADPHEFFSLGPLLEVELPFSIKASDWAEMSEKEAGEAEGQAMDTLFELEDDDE
jgi:hypothetical protein